MKPARVARAAGLVLFTGVALYLIWAVGDLTRPALLRVLERIEASGPLAPILFAAIYITAVVALVPGSLLTLAGGALFGLALGTLVVFVSATAGAGLAFLLARHLVRPRVERRIAGDARFERIDRAVSREGARVVFLLRLTPIVPFNLLNYALGVTGVSFGGFLLASAGMLPGTLLYVYTGHLLGQVAAVAAGVQVERGVGVYVVTGLGLAATSLLVVFGSRLAREALRESEREGESQGSTSPPLQQEDGG